MKNRLLSVQLPLSSIDLSFPFLFRWAIVLGVLFVSAYAARTPSIIYLLAVVGIIGGIALLRMPALGLAGLVVGTLIVPFSISTGSQTPINITIIMIPALLILWLAGMIRRRQVWLKQSHVNLALLALVGSAIVSYIAGGMPWNSFAGTAPLTAQLGGLAIFIFSAGVFLLVGNQLDDEHWLETLTLLFLATATAYMVGRFRVPLLISLADLMNGLGSDGSMFWVWIVALASGQLLFNQKLNRWMQLWLTALIAMTLYVGWFLARSWTSGYLPPMVTLGVILWFRSKKLAMLAALAAMIFFLMSGRVDLLGSLAGLKEYSILTRDVAREILIEQVFPLSPLIGLGPANYYFYTPLYPILGWYVSFNSHNNYVDIIMQTGLVGLVCFFWVIWEIGQLAWGLRKRFAGDFAQGYVYACLGGIAGTLVSCWLADWLLPFVYNIGLRGYRASVLAWIFMGGLVTLQHLVRRSQSAITK